MIAAVAGGDYAVVEAGGVANGTPGDPDGSGQLTVTDVDDGEDHFEVPASLAGTYGSFTFDEATGEWTYTLDNSLAAPRRSARASRTDTLTVTSHDGTSYNVIVNITGTNDAATISGDNDGDVVEDTTLTASGTLSVADEDSGEAELVPVLAGTAGDNGYGTFEVGADGAWTYTLDNSLAAVQSLPARAT